MPEIIQGIDHPVIAVRDMEAARAAYERLGFTIPPRGSHQVWGTGNWCIMFPHDYLELRGVVDLSKSTPHAQSLLERGEGLMGVALATDDAEAAYQVLCERGLHPRPVRRLSRDFELPEGTVQPQFALCFLDEKETGGLMSVVLCQHLTPELLRKPEWLEHANGAQHVHSLTCVVPDLEQSRAKLERIFGAQPISLVSDSLVIDFAKRGRIVVMTRECLLTHYPQFDLERETREEFLAVVTIAIDDLDSCRRFLDDRKIETFDTNRDSICVASEEACSAVLEFVSLDSTQK